MKTEVEMIRPFMGLNVRQKSKTGFFNATDLVKIANLKRAELLRSNFNLNEYLRNKGTIEFIKELQKQYPEVIKRSRGRNAQTWVHPLLFLDIALAVDPKFKVDVYQWLYDELLKYRNNSGESYKKMCGALYDRVKDKNNFHRRITKLASAIKEKCNVENWENASEDQLELRDKIHNNIYLLCSVLNNPKEAVRLGIKEALKNIV